MGTAIGDLLERESISLDFLSQRIVGIDSYNILYQFLSSIRNYDGSLLMSSNGRVSSHLSGLFYRTINLIQKGIKPVFVFDGKPSKLKSETLKKRIEIRTDAEKEYKKALEVGNLEDAKKFASRALHLTDEMVKEAKKLIELMGLPLIEASSEGEAQIAFMMSKNDLYGCVSQDYDSLLFGASKVFRNITVSGKRKLPGKNIFVDIEPEKIELEKNLERLGISRQKLIWIGILIGTDFNEKFPKIGPKTALKLVQKFNSFEEIIQETKFSPEFDFKEVEELFMHPNVLEKYEIKFSSPQKEKIKNFLCTEFDFAENRVENALNKLSEKLEEKGAQSSLKKWS